MTKKSKGKASLKASKPKVKKVEIRRELGPNRRHGMNEWQYAYARPNAETWATGYARPFTAKRGAHRYFKEWLAKGNKIEFINNY